jgi:hypothetical protein
MLNELIGYVIYKCVLIIYTEIYRDYTYIYILIIYVIVLLYSNNIITHMLRIEADSSAMSQHGHFMKRQPVEVTTLVGSSNK